VYAQKLMRPKPLITVLALMLSGINCDAASMCANRCMSSASAANASAVTHHHQMESQPVATHNHHIHARTHAAYCTECPPELGNNLNKSADCQSLLQIQAISEAFFPFNAPREGAHVDVPHTPTDPLALADDGGPSLLCDICRTIRSSNTPSVPLRI
jgi:hypothetical protein